jgi:glutathione S-transferase
MKPARRTIRSRTSCTKGEAKKRAANFTSNRIPKFLGYFERILKMNAKGGDFVFGKKAAYSDLSLFQMIEGLRYAFPKTMARLEPQHPRLVTLHDRVMARPRIAARLSSPRRLAFNDKAFSATIRSWKRDDAKGIKR